MADVLSAAGYSVAEASDGVEGLREARQTQFSAIITDVMMPYKDGIDLCKEVRSSLPETKLILISGAAVSLPDVVEVVGLEDVPILQKPFSDSQLLETVERCCGPARS